MYVLVFWKWQDSAPCVPEDHNSDGEDSDEGCSEGGTGEGTDTDGDEYDSILITHSVIFKCVGDSHSQELLAMAAQKQEKVEVRLRKEPNNPKDSCAIAFDCKLTSKD